MKTVTLKCDPLVPAGIQFHIYYNGKVQIAKETTNSDGSSRAAFLPPTPQLPPPAPKRTKWTILDILGKDFCIRNCSFLVWLVFSQICSGEKCHTKHSTIKFHILPRGGSRIFRRKGCQPSRRGRQHTNLPDFPKKLHEIKKILVRRGAPPPLDPPVLPLLMKNNIREKIFLEGSNYYCNIFVTWYTGYMPDTVKSNTADLIPRLIQNLNLVLVELCH